MDEENTEYIKLPVTERCTHKNWKARVHGYTEAAKIFQQIDDEKSPEWNKFLGLVKKFVIDSNVVAQEKGLEAVLAFVENSAVAGKTVGEVMSGIVAKCIGAPKAKTKELAAQITLMYIEQEKQELVIEELLKGTEHKNPKVVCGCINVITQAIREFGVKVINVKPLVKKIPSLLEDRDKGVRDEGKAMVVEMHRWIGPALTPQLSALKPVQMTELGQEFEKAHGEKATPTRYLRSQQVRQAKEAAEQGEEADRGAGDDEEEAAGQDIDPYELMEPVNILAKLPKDFYDKVEAKKWQERKETMETLEAFLKSAPKLENGDYFELVKALKRLIGKDSNVVVVALATKNLGGLASGLKKRFSQYASTCIPVLLEKFREKKANVVTALRETIDAVYQATTLEAIQEDVLAALDNKNPSVKAETAIFLSRCFQRCTTLILTKKLLKVYTAALCKTLNESDPTVRDNSAEALGTAMKVVSEKAITPFLENVDSLKLAKIKECSEKAEILVKQPTVKPAPAAVKTAAKPSAGSTAPKAVKRPASASGAAAAGSSKTQKAASGGGAGAPARKGAASNAGKGKSGAAKVATERELSDEEVLEKAEAILSSEILNGLADANWKTRLAVMEQFTQILGTLEPASVSSQVLFKILNKKPGIKDTNFQVAKLKLEAVKMITTTFPVTSVGVNCVLLDIVDKLNEAKTVTIASECLTELSEATKLEAVSTEVLDYAMNRQKSPKVQVEVFNWLSTALLEFGFQVNAKALMENVKKGVAATSQVVRTAAISLLGTLYVFMGPQLHLFFENEKPALVQQINAECDKRTGETAPAPVRGLRRARSQDLLEDGGGGGDDPAEEGVAATVCIQDIVPRTDITGYITDALVSELQDKNWKVRSEAIQKLQNIINELRFISGSLGEVAPLLGARLVDSNSKIAQNAIALCESIATAAGTAGAKQYVRYVFPGLLQCTGDSKAWIRTAAVSCINTYGELCGYKEFFEGEMIYDALKGGSPALRAEVWSWLSVKLPNMKTVPKEELLVCLPVLYANLEDRNADVRKNASEALIGFMYHLGYSPMMSACEKLKPASSSQVRGLLDKARCLVPDRPTPASKAKGAGSSQAVNSAGAQAKAKLAPGSSATITKSSSKAKTANAAKGSGSAGSRKEEEVDVTPLLPINNQKNQRVIDEQKLKTLKWNFTTPRDEFVELLRDQMTAAGVNKALIANMFHPDFKYHLKAIDQLNEDLGTNLQSLACNLDLILRWMTLRFFDTNPSVILKGLEYLQTAFNMLIDDDYILLENEASAFIPYLVLKVGDPKDAVRNSVRALFKQIVLMYPVSKMFTYIMDGLKSKNARQRSECLEQLGSLIETIGTTVCQPSASVALKEIAKHISDRDNSVRNGAINCIVAAYFLDGEKVLKTVGQISDKDMSLLEERIKRAAKNRPVASIKPMPVQQQPQQQSRPASAVRPHAASPPSPEPVDEEIDELQQPEPTPQNDGGEQTLNSSREYESSGFHPVERNDDIDDENVDLNLSSRSLPPQPVTGPYRLDPDFLASIEVPVNIQRPQFKEVDLSFLQEPVPQLTRSLKLTSTSPLSKLSHPSTIEWQIQQIGSPNLETALTAMSQIETVLLSEKRNNLQDHVDKFVTQLVNQLIFLNQSNHPDLVSCYRLNFSLLMKLYYYPELSCKVSESVIKDVINQLISLLTEKKLEMYDSTEMFVKVVNCLVLRILERSEHTASTCALLKLLYDTVNSDTIPSYQELIMKCIWRVVKNIPEWDDVEELDYDRILPDIHTFLKDYPSHWWKKQPSDTPLRTVKTLLHTLVKMKGYDLLPHVKKVKGITPESEMSTYCNKLLRTLKVVDNAASDAQDKKEKCKARRMPKSFRDQLSDIFIKIGSKTETKEGLRMLYEFKQQHPDADIQPFLEKSTKFFQDYIQRGLQAIEVEQRHNTDTTAPARHLNYTDSQSEKDTVQVSNNKELDEPPLVDGVGVGMGEEVDDNPEMQQLQQFMKRLRVLQAKANLLPNATSDSNAVSMATSQPASPPPNDVDLLPSRKPVFDTIVNESPEKKSPDSKSMESLRQRLEKIKQGARLDTSS